MCIASQGQERHPAGRQDGAVQSLGEPPELCPADGASFLPFPAVPCRGRELSQEPPFHATKSGKEEIEQAAPGDFCLEARWLPSDSNQGPSFSKAGQVEGSTTEGSLGTTVQGRRAWLVCPSRHVS